MPRTPDTDAEASEDLTVGIQTRISEAAQSLLKERAREDGIKPATWIRLRIYEGLGLRQRSSRGRK